MMLISMMWGLILISMFMMWYEVCSFLGLVLVIWFIKGYSLISNWGMEVGLGIDLLSWCLICLSLWMGGLMFLASVRLKGLFLGVVLMLVFLLVFSFYMQDLIYFYIMFEGSMIPIFFLVMGWGYQPERLQAGVYLLFYTLFGSLPLLIVILLIYSLWGSMWFGGMMKFGLLSIIWSIMSFLGFLIKLPMFFFHLWLPSAHVEAPISGSMMLAGVLLKLGGYGLFRVMGLFKEVVVKLGVFFLMIGIVGAVYIGLVCLRQSDLKSLIAYSSVSHMGLVLGGIMIMNNWGWEGGLVMMIGHGLCSSGLFCLANVGYERVGSRSLMINKGLMLWYPGMCLWWFMLSVCNMSSPPSLNLFGEVVLYLSIISWFKGIFFVLFIASFLSGAYSIYMFSFSQHGEGVLMGLLKESKCSEYFLMFMHWLPLNLLILSSDMVIGWM